MLNRNLKEGRKNCGEDFSSTTLLVEKSMYGDHAALEDLCNAIAKGVLYRVMYGVDSREDAEDVSQNVLIRVCENIHSLREAGLFRAWLGKIIMNETSSYRASAAKQRGTVNIDECHETIAEEREIFLPHEYLVNEEVREFVLDAISKLASRQRQAVMFHYYDGLSITDIGKAMEITKQGAAALLQRAQENVRLELGKRSFVSSFSSYGMVPMGYLLTDVLKSDAAGFMAYDSDWIQNTITQCQEYIAACVATTTASSTSPADIVLTATAATAAVTATATAATGPASFGAIILSSAAAVTVAATGAAIVLSAPEEPLIAPPVHEIVIEGSVAFSGGEDRGGHLVYVNPQSAVPEASSTGGELIVLHWWISGAGSEEILFEGEGEVDETLAKMKANGHTGEYMLTFRLRDELGAIHRIGGNFYIMRLPNSFG